MVQENIERLELDSDFAKVLKRADEIQSDCADFIVKAHDIRMDNDLNLCFADKKMPMSAFASSGLCGKLKIPTVYYNRCAEQNKELAARNVNEWLYEDDRQFMVRGYKDTARGLLSGSYSKFDAPEILRAFDEVFKPIQAQGLIR